MHSILKAVLLSATVAVLAPHSALASNTPSFPHLIVKGEATAEVRPDKATLTLRISAFDPQSAVAMETVQRQLLALFERLAAHSVPSEAIASYNLSKEVKRERVDRIETKILGYFVSRRVRIELADLSSFSELVADIARMDNVSSISARFDVTDRERYETDLMQEAAADARRKAEIMLHGMARALGPVYAVGESSFGSTTALFSLASDRPYAAAMMDAESYAETVFQPSTIELEQSLHVVFALE